MTNAADKTPANKHHRWFQFGLRGLLLLVLLVAVALFVCREYLKPYWRQQQTVALVEKLRGSCQTTEVGSPWLRWLGCTHNNSDLRAGR